MCLIQANSRTKVCNYVRLFNAHTGSALLIAIGNINTVSEIGLYSYMVNTNTTVQLLYTGINAGKLLTLYG